MRAPDSEYDPRRWQESELPPRRRLVRWGLAAGVAILVAWVVVITLHPSGDIIPGSFGGAMLPLILAGSMSPFARQRWLTRRALAGYDEFERTAIADAVLRAYNLFLLIVLVPGIVLANIAPADLPPRSTLLGWTFALIVLGASLPTVIAEWSVPMPDPEDQPL